MINLVLFSLKRRFVNKTNKVLLILLVCLSVFGLFFDQIVEFFSSDDQTTLIRLENIDENQFLLNALHIEVDESSSLSISRVDNNFLIESESILSDIEKIELESLIYPYYQAQLDPSIQEVLINYRHPEIEYKTTTQENYQQKHDNLFMVITMIYFMMIGFAGMLAQEVVAEKTSNILEMIGTSVSLKTHYYSKIIIGWLSILGQFVFVGSVFVGVLLLRVLFDNGRGLLQLLAKYNFIDARYTTITSMIKQFLSNTSSITDLLISLVFLFIGILIIQLILVVVSTGVSSVEEAGALQNPFYIGLLFMYYGAMILNNSSSMTSGWGFFLSFLPVFSMIFMPSRIMIYPVSNFQILFALIINFFVLMFVIKRGEKIYINNVLNFSRRHIVKK